VRALPSVVVEHFRHPKNEGPLAPADARGVVEGRTRGSRLTLFLKLDPTRPERPVAAASFTVEEDRSCRVGLSLLTTWLLGRPLAQVEALTVEALAQAWDIPMDSWPMLVIPLEALHAALADLRGLPNPCLADGVEVCHCLQVREGRIRRAIRGRALRNIEDVQFWTRACTGCRSCRADVERILSEERLARSSARHRLPRA
jgi:bacterioferritin-associated ferredoxin/NifU-like protein involved in Fe-S cluster formation